MLDFEELLNILLLTVRGLNLKKIFIEDIKEGARVEGAFLVTRKNLAQSRAGKPYIAMRLMDKTGDLEARVWDSAERLSKGFKLDDVVSLKGSAVEYQGKVQINVSSIERVEDSEYDLRDYLISSKRDPQEMMKEVDAIVDSMEDAYIKALLQGIFSDDDLRRAYMTAPAAKMMHHPYLGGLLEHVVSLLTLGDFAASHYKETVNRDLLLAGLMLHDIGKVTELSYERSFNYTTEGKLIGHIVMGVELIERRARLIEGFPDELLLHLKHIILSHHGILEYGSPKRPKTVEALLISHLDDMDAKMNAIGMLVEGYSDEGSEGDEGDDWTDYQRIFERYIYRRPYRSGVEPTERSNATEDENEAASEDTPEDKDDMKLF